MEVNQKKLHELEQLCVREQPPAAMAACPLHVNCRDICSNIAAGNFSEARAAYEKSVTFPEVLSRVCGQPCRLSCTRGKCGDPLFMRQLERSAMELGQIKPKRLFLPRKKERAAIVGGGVTGLTAAAELGKKGYQVTIFEKDIVLWGSLREDGRLEEEIFHREQKKLGGYPVSIVYGKEISEPEKLLGEYGVVVIAWGRKREPVNVREGSFQTGDTGMFAGGDAIRETPGTCVESMAEGKRLAISADRYLKKVSMDAGREKEGVFKTTLHVRWEQEDEKKSRAEGREYLTREESIEEAGRCLDCQCTDCTDACAFMRHYKSYPKKYLREIYNNLSIAMGTRHANKMINSCTLCGQCGAVCPHGLNLGETIREARRIMVEKKKMPPSAFEFALNDMNYSNSEKAFLSRCRPGDSQSEYVFFPGCQMTAAAPRTVERAYLDLMKRIDKSVGLMLGCCGIMADWAGERQLFEGTLKKIKEEWKRLGSPVMILACPTCYDVFSHKLPEIPCKGIWDILLEIGLPKEYEVCSADGIIHDSCGARSHPQIRAAIRQLAETMGYRLTEEAYKEEQSLCCGYGGLAPVSNPQVADAMTRQLTEEETGLRLTYCINCRDRMVRQEGKAVHILELIYDPEECGRRKAPGYSLRRDNRYELKQRLLEQVWMEKTAKEECMKLVYSQKTGDMLEQRKILESDIRTVLNWAENGHRIRDEKKKCFIGHRQAGNVTFWVYYRPCRSGEYEILNAYSHRMTITGEGV
ncbi:MAG: pyridine nucleotide-disulfide oxidoreductase/dicluster-binding protein [Ruminococcus sp.]